MNNLEIIRVGIGDLQLLQAIGRQTFYETFADANTEQDMNQYLDESFAGDKLVAEITNPEVQLFFAKLDTKVVGYLKLNFGQAQTELQDGQSLEIERIYVLEAYQGAKVGQSLYDKALQIAQEARLACLWLGVWENNTKAIRFYQKNGFVVFDKHVFRLGNDEQTDLMMRLDITTKNLNSR